VPELPFRICLSPPLSVGAPTMFTCPSSSNPPLDPPAPPFLHDFFLSPWSPVASLFSSIFFAVDSALGRGPYDHGGVFAKGVRRVALARNRKSLVVAPTSLPTSLCPRVHVSFFLAFRFGALLIVQSSLQ